MRVAAFGNEDLVLGGGFVVGVVGEVIGCLAWRRKLVRFAGIVIIHDKRVRVGCYALVLVSARDGVARRVARLEATALGRRRGGDIGKIVKGVLIEIVLEVVVEIAHVGV